MSRRHVKVVKGTADGVSSTNAISRDGKREIDPGVRPPQVALSMVDYTLVLSLVIGGCCTNVWAFEQLLNIDPHFGSALTFSQMLFISLQSLPSFLTWDSLPNATHRRFFPRLRPRQVPIRQWALQVVMQTSGSLLNNLAFAYKVPLTVQIVFRSAGLAVSMLFGYLFLKKRYSITQIGAVTFVSAGVILATLSKPTSSPSSSKVAQELDVRKYSFGVAMLTISLFLTGLLGLLQERTYRKYGPYWKEGVFYTHILSLPVFLFLVPQVKDGYSVLAKSSSRTYAGIPSPYFVLALNLVAQLVCVSGVNQLTSRTSSVSTQIVLTTRKALSLCFSVWWFGSGWNAQLGVGAGMVFLGTLLYTTIGSRGAHLETAQKKKVE